MSKLEKMKFVVDVALSYFMASFVFDMMGMFASSLFYTNGMTFVKQISANSWYLIVRLGVLLILSYISYRILKRRQLGIASGHKQLLLMMTGVLLIVDGILRMPTYATQIRFIFDQISSIDNGNSQGQKSTLVAAIYWTTAPIVIYTVQAAFGFFLAWKGAEHDAKHGKEHVAE